MEEIEINGPIAEVANYIQIYSLILYTHTRFPQNESLISYEVCWKGLQLCSVHLRKVNDKTKISFIFMDRNTAQPRAKIIGGDIPILINWVGDDSFEIRHNSERLVDLRSESSFSSVQEVLENRGEQNNRIEKIVEHLYPQTVQAFEHFKNELTKDLQKEFCSFTTESPAAESVNTKTQKMASGGNSQPEPKKVTENDRKIMEMWGEGYTAGDIGQAMNLSAGRIRNKLSKLRKEYGEKRVPYHSH